MTDTRAVARYDGPRTVEDLERYSLTLAVNSTPDGRAWRNDALPATFRGNPAAVAFAVEYAKALDVSPVTALIGIHIVDGKPTASAGLISALVRRAGHKIRTWVEGSIEEGNAKGITTITRADDPGFEYRSEWTLPRAERAKLMKRTDDGRYVAVKDKSAWSTYPENMLKSRSITECARDAAEDAILGVHYTPEELGVEVDESGEPVHVVTSVQSTRVDPPAAKGDRFYREPDAQQTPAAEPTPPATPSAAGPTPAAGETQAAPPAAAPTETRDPGDVAREWILAARSRDDLAARWKADGWTVDAAKAHTTADEAGAEIAVLDLFRRQTAAIDAGNPLVDLCEGYGDDDGSPAEPSGDKPGGSDNGVQQAQRDVGAKLERERQERIDHRDSGGPAPSSGPPVDATLDDATTNRRDLATIMDGLTPGQRDAVVSWAGLNGIGAGDLTEDEAAAIVEGIASGDALPDRVRGGVDPLELVGRILGGTVVSDEPTTPEEQHRRTIEEQHEDARQATPAHRGTPPKGAGREAFKQARRQTAGTRKEGDNA